MDMELISDLKGLFILGIFVAVFGGIFSYVLGMITPVFAGLPFVTALIGIVLALILAGYSKLEELKLFDFVILLAVAGIVGSLVILILPMASPFILTIGGALTVSGLVWTFVYILFAGMVKGKLNM